MIHIQYRLDKSHKHGIGLFANQDIQAGELVYSASPKLDLNISQETFESLKSGEQEEIRYWGFWIEENKVWHVDFDMSKFINHSFQANISTRARNHPRWRQEINSNFIPERQQIKKLCVVLERKS